MRAAATLTIAVRSTAIRRAARVRFARTASACLTVVAAFADLLNCRRERREITHERVDEVVFVGKSRIVEDPTPIGVIGPAPALK